MCYFLDLEVYEYVEDGWQNEDEERGQGNVAACEGPPQGEAAEWSRASTESAGNEEANHEQEAG